MYSVFVRKILERIYEAIAMPLKNLSCFCEGSINLDYTTLQDYSALSGEQAVYFISVIKENADIFDINEKDYELVPSAVKKFKYPHSCYPKNIRRWMNGTISRKKKCRVEFTALVICWANGWGSDDAKYLECRKDLYKICADMLEENVMTGDPDTRDLADVLWRANCKCCSGK